MILTDTGPLVALIDRNDPNHMRCVEAAKKLPTGPAVTTWPCFTEAMYLLYRAGGFPAQVVLWELVESERLVLHDLGFDEVNNMVSMMEKYRDTPMDLADASLVAAAENLGTKRIFTLDRDFYIYRLADGTALDVAP